MIPPTIVIDRSVENISGLLFYGTWNGDKLHMIFSVDIVDHSKQELVIPE